MPARPARHSALHGNVADHARTALLLIDVINTLNFPGARGLLPRALAMANEIAGLRRAAYEQGIPVIYANDNFGRWRSSFAAQESRGGGPTGRSQGPAPRAGMAFVGAAAC